MGFLRKDNQQINAKLKFFQTTVDGTKLLLPDGDNWFHHDKNTGTEKLYLVASKDPISGFTGKVEKLNNDGIDAIDKMFPDATIQ